MKRTTIIDLLNESVEKYADNPFLWEKFTDEFLPTTYKETKEQAHLIAAGLMALGVKIGEKISLLSEGKNAWITSELGILHTGAINVPLSIKLEESNDLIFRIQHSESKWIMVSSGQLSKIRNIINELPDVEKVIILEDQDKYQDKEMALSQIIAMGKEALKKEPDLVEKIASQIKPDDYATISYTSGTTADPKGVLLTHRNYTANVEQALTLMSIPTSYKTLLILPLDHCFAHVAGFYSFMASGASVATVQVGKTGMQTLRNIPINIQEFKPNLLLSVPALAKNFKNNIESTVRSQGAFVHKLFNYALKTSISYNKEGHNKGQGLQALKKPLIWLFDKIIFSKVRQGLGGELDFFIGGGALLDIDLQRFYYAIGIPMFQGYGLSEATPIISSNGLERHKLGSSGVLVKPMELKICDIDGKELPLYTKGEIVIKGENVMAGYFKNEVATAEAIRDDWLYTGDMGYMDKDGFLYVVGRFKSLLIAGDGEKYSPEGIEESIVENSQYIDQIILYNNQNPYTTAVLVPNIEALKNHVNETDSTLDWNSEEAKKLAIEKLQNEINDYRKGGKFEGNFPERWLPTTFAIADEPWTEQNGLVNSTMKIVRGKVEKLYEQRIENLYTTEGREIFNADNLTALK